MTQPEFSDGATIAQTCPTCARPLEWAPVAEGGHLAIAEVCPAHGSVAIRDPLA
jgi:uncharacterized radical SAM superfamily Fe-S cluster-containing enzyme